MQLEPGEHALLRHALARGFLTQAQVDEALGLRAAAAARGQPAQLLVILRERYLDPSVLPELAAVYEQQTRPAGSMDASTVLTGAPPPPADERQIGPYQVVREIARGGMGVVYVARRAGESQDLALKLLLNSERAEPNEVERFKIEAAAAGRLSHPNVVKIHDVGQDARGCHYMVMDYVEGDSLLGLLRRQGVMDPRQAARMTIKMARAMQHAHDLGVLHRDLKPANVLVREGEPLIADFGLAKQQGADGKSLTVTGEVMGTPAYMPPEQAEGARKEVDARSDQYSLGATLYQMLTGLPPFQGQSPINIVMAVLSKPPTAPRKRRPELDPELEAIVLKTLAKEREDRYSDCEALAQALEAWLGEGPAPTKSKGPLLALAALVLIALGAGVGFLSRSQPSAASPSPPPPSPSPTPTRSPDPSPTPSAATAESPTPTPARVAPPAPSPSPLPEPLFDDSTLERVVRLDGQSITDAALEHLEVDQPWLVTQTPEGLSFRGNRNASPRLRLPLIGKSPRNRLFLIRLEFRVTHLGGELRFGVGLSSQVERRTPQLWAVAMEARPASRPNFRGLRVRHRPQVVLDGVKQRELFSPQLEGFRPDQDLTLEVRGSAKRLELTTLVDGEVVGRTQGPRPQFDTLQGGALDLEVGFLQSDTHHGRRWGGFSRQLNFGQALFRSCELFAQPQVLKLDETPVGAWRLLGLAGRALARGDLARTEQLLATPALTQSAERGVQVRLGFLRALVAFARQDRALAITELRRLEAREVQLFPSQPPRAQAKKAFPEAMGFSYWGLRTSDLPLVEAPLRELLIEAYRAHLLDPEVDALAFAAGQGHFFELNPDTLPGLGEAFRAAQAGDTKPLAEVVRVRLAKTLRREEAWGLRHHLSSWLALNLALAEPLKESAEDTAAGYLWQFAGALDLGRRLLAPALESQDPLRRWVAANFTANARYRQGDHAGALALWQALEEEALAGPLSLPDGSPDLGLAESLRGNYQAAKSSQR